MVLPDSPLSKRVCRLSTPGARRVACSHRGVGDAGVAARFAHRGVSMEGDAQPWARGPSRSPAHSPAFRSAALRRESMAPGDLGKLGSADVFVEGARIGLSSDPMPLRRHELSDAQWAKLESLLPARGRPGHDARTFVNAVLFVAGDRRGVAGPAGAVRELEQRLAAVQPVERRRPVGEVRRGPRRAGPDRTATGQRQRPGPPAGERKSAPAGRRKKTPMPGGASAAAGAG